MMDMTSVIVNDILNDEKKMARIANIAATHDQLGQAKNYICALSRKYKVKVSNDDQNYMAWKIVEEVWYGRKAE